MSEARDTIRLDKWLWQARFFKTRTLAAKQVSGGHVRVNGQKVAKAATSVGPGDTLTFAQGRQIRVIEIVALGTRRGPAPEAQALYLDKSPPQETVRAAPSFEGKGRPTKKTRRALDLSRRTTLE
ncbi:MAG: RNA-binding S4 domain-containing protein [Litoreibacter sp.]|nr:RNA-binding S4 domain-containing protein [Litoreibacter sp.]